MDTRDMVTLNGIVQIVLFLAVICAGYLARKKRLIVHCRLMRITGGLLIISILALMLPLMLEYTPAGIKTFTGFEIIAHHSIGVIVVLLWIFINLCQMRVIKWPWRLRVLMRTAAAGWALSILLGAHLYLRIW